MMQENEKTTVPVPSVGADGEQSLSYVTNEIITTGNEEINPIDESMEEMLRQMQRMSDPSYLATMTMSQLYDTVYESRLPIIDGLLYPGTYLFVGCSQSWQVISDGTDCVSCQHRTSALELFCPWRHCTVPCIGR